MPNVTVQTCQFCHREGPCVTVEYPYGALFFRCAEGCEPPVEWMGDGDG